MHVKGFEQIPSRSGVVSKKVRWRIACKRMRNAAVSFGRAELLAQVNFLNSGENV